MMNVSGVNTGAARPLTAVEEVKEKSKVQDPEEKEKERLPKPIKDQYVPEEKKEPIGRYWMEEDEDGKPKIHFDDPDQDREAKGPDQKEPDKKTEKCVGNTDKVDREIEKLKRKQKELKQQINSETDEVKIKELEGKLAQVERELRQKDNDGYRRSHTVFS